MSSQIIWARQKVQSVSKALLHQALSKASLLGYKGSAPETMPELAAPGLLVDRRVSALSKGRMVIVAMVRYTLQRLSLVS